MDFGNLFSITILNGTNNHLVLFEYLHSTSEYHLYYDLKTPDVHYIKHKIVQNDDTSSQLRPYK